jgi:hypothetical protein
MPTIAGAVCDPGIVAAWTSRCMNVPARPGFGVSGLVTGDTISKRDSAYRRVAVEAGQLERSPAVTAAAHGPVVPSELERARIERAAARCRAETLVTGDPISKRDSAYRRVAVEAGQLERSPAVTAAAHGPVVTSELERAHIERAAARCRAETAVAVAGGVRDQSGLLRDMFQYVDRVYADFFEKAAREQEWNIDPASGKMCWPEVESDESTAEERLRAALECFTDALFGVGSRAPVGYAQLTEYTLQISGDIGAESAREYACGVLSQLDAGSDCEVGGVLDEWGGRLLYMVRTAKSLGFSGAARQSAGRWCGKGRARRHAIRR